MRFLTLFIPVSCFIFCAVPLGAFLVVASWFGHRPLEDFAAAMQESPRVLSVDSTEAATPIRPSDPSPRAVLQSCDEPQLTSLLIEYALSEKAADKLWFCWNQEKGKEPAQDLAKGTDLLSKKQYDSAREVFQRLMQQYPDWAEPVNKKATLEFMLGNYEQSKILCRRVLKMKPMHFGALSGLSMVHMHMGEWQEAHLIAKRLQSISPRYGDLLVEQTEDKV
jgi:tetratricopeptide (TPR) repeat protein